MNLEMSETKEQPDVILSRHSYKPKSEDTATERYPGIAGIRGIERVEQKVGEILDILEKSPERTVLFIGGASEQIRTKSTAEAIGDKLAQRVEADGRDDIVVLTRQQIRDFTRAEDGDDPENVRGFNFAEEQVIKFLEDNKDKKVVIDLPLMLRAFRERRWLTEDRSDDHQFVYELMEKYKDEPDPLVPGLGDWLENGTRGKYPQLDPEQVAIEELSDLYKLQAFADRYLGGRPTTVAVFSHGFNTDALAAYIAGNGKIDAKGYMDALQGQGRFQEAEIAQINLEPMTLQFRGRTLKAKPLVNNQAE